MNYEQARTQAGIDNFVIYLLAGISLFFVGLLDLKLKNKSNYVFFLVKSSYLVIPGSVVSAVSIGTGSFVEVFFIWLIATVLIYVFLISPIYLAIRFAYLFLRKIRKNSI